MLLDGLGGAFAVEATTCNPAQGEVAIEWAEDARERANQDIAYGAIKLHRALRRKLTRRPAYWELAHVAGKPFVLAVQDFREPGSMRYLTPILTEYVFGVRHRRREDATGALEVEWLEEHRVGNMREPSGFFRQEGAEGVSAVIANPLGTLPKFNRMGYLAGFGDRRVRGMRAGLERRDFDAASPAPRSFSQEIHASVIGRPGWKAWWCCTIRTRRYPWTLTSYPVPATSFCSLTGRSSPCCLRSTPTSAPRSFGWMGKFPGSWATRLERSALRMPAAVNATRCVGVLA